MFDLGAVLEDHVLKDGAVVGFGDAGGFLHDPRGQAYLAADEPAAGFLAAADPLRLHGVGVLNSHVGVGRRQAGDHGAIAFGLGQIVSDLDEGVAFEHHRLLYWLYWLNIGGSNALNARRVSPACRKTGAAG